MLNPCDFVLKTQDDKLNDPVHTLRHQHDKFSARVFILGAQIKVLFVEYEIYYMHLCILMHVPWGVQYFFHSF